MKHSLIIGLLTLSVVSAFADSAKVPPSRRRRPDTSGGYLIRPGSGEGAVRVVDLSAPKRNEAMLNDVVNGIKSFMTIDIAAASLDIPFDLKSIDEIKTKVGAKEVILLVGEPTLPMTLVAPEAGWGLVNISALSADGATAEQVDFRMKLELWRVFALVNGAGNSNYDCVMKSVHSLADLDNLKTYVLCPEPYNKMRQDLTKRGITPIRMTTYQKACEEGWAPAPTNDVQRAVYEQVKADKERGPTRPIEIPPPGKK